MSIEFVQDGKDRLAIWRREFCIATLQYNLANGSPRVIFKINDQIFMMTIPEMREIIQRADEEEGRVATERKNNLSPG